MIRVILVIIPGMVFNVNLGLSGLEDTKAKKKYALFIGDTVLVNEVRALIGHTFWKAVSQCNMCHG